MDSQATILASRFARVREMRDEIARLNVANQKLRGEMESLQTHFSLALMAAVDLALVPRGGLFIIVDGWNIVLGGGRRKRTPKDIQALARKYLAIHKRDFIWIVWDAPDEGGMQRDRLRMSWTGGIGKQRADKMICDFIRMSNWRGSAHHIRIVTRDRELLDTANRLIRKGHV